MLNSVENGDNFVASSDYLRNKDKILNTGIPLYEYDGGISNHAKSILIDDDLSVIGSYNLDLRSSYLDTELMLVVESRELNQELGGYMEEMEADSRRALPDGTYEVPEHVTVEEVPFWKRAAWSVVGFLLQPSYEPGRSRMLSRSDFNSKCFPVHKSISRRIFLWLEIDFISCVLEGTYGTGIGGESNE